MVDYKSLIGRQWNYGVFDCYSIVRDYYALLGIDLPNYQRPNDPDTCESIFLKNAPKFFKQIKTKNIRIKIRVTIGVKKFFICRITIITFNFVNNGLSFLSVDSTNGLGFFNELLHSVGS